MSGVFDEPGRGRKQCPSCKRYVGAPSSICPSCKHEFVVKPRQTRPSDKSTKAETPKRTPVIRQILDVVSIPGVGMVGNMPLCPVKPAGEWPHTDDEVREWVSRVIDSGINQGRLYLPEAICYMARHTVWPLYRNGCPCPESNRVIQIIKDHAQMIVGRYQKPIPISTNDQLPKTEPVEQTTEEIEDIAPPPRPEPSMCPCGQPLHYADPEKRKQVEKQIAELGPNVNVKSRGTTYSIPRHFIALHGIKAGDLDSLAEKGIAQITSR